MQIAIFGMGYVGVVSAACLARLGHNIVGVDLLEKKVHLLQKGISPIVEPGLKQLVKEGVEEGRLQATTDARIALARAEVVLVCVGTPPKPNGEVDLKAVLRIAKDIARQLNGDENKPPIIFRSTIPPGTMENFVLPLFGWEKNAASNVGPQLFYHPEFLREGSAVDDFFRSPQVVVAKVNQHMSDEASTAFFRDIYHNVDLHFHLVELRTAEMIKYVNNSFHALKVSFANEIARICRGCGVNTHELFELFLADRKLNISTAYLRPGFAFGGSCLPKDLNALKKIAHREDVDVPVLTGVGESNQSHPQLALDLIVTSGERRLGFLGLGFKPETDDVRESPYLKLIETCIGKGFVVRIYDRSINYENLLGKNLTYLNQHIDHISERLATSANEVIRLTDLIVLCHPDRHYIEAVLACPEKRVLDLTGQLCKSDLSPGRQSIVLPEHSNDGNGSIEVIHTVEHLAELQVAAE